MPRLNLDINPNQFSKNFFRVKNCDKLRLWLYGGSGAGKTFSVLQFLVLESYQERAKGRTIYVIKENADKMESTLINDVYNPSGGGIIHKWGLKKDFTYNKTKKTLINKITGVTIKFMGINSKDAETAKGLTAPHIVFVDEISAYKNSEVYDQLLIRVRIDGARMIFCFNPIDENHWIKKEVFDIDEGEIRQIIKTTYRDNREWDNKTQTYGKWFVPEYYRNLLESYKETNLNKWRIYANGEWGKIVPEGGRFYNDFDINHHVKKEAELKYNRELPLHISFDFNVNPYMTCTVWQLDNGHAMQIEEICLGSPSNNTPATARRFAKLYWNHEQEIYVYGDPAGRNRDTRGEIGWNDFTFIEQELTKANLSYQMKIKSKAPNISARGIFLNRVFRGDVEGISISISDRCTKTVEDYVYLLETMEGKKHKEKARDENKVTYEKYGHTSDANDYFLCYVWDKEMRAMKGGRTKIISGK